MDLLRLAPKIQQHILSMPDMAGRPPATERTLRRIETEANVRDQIRELQKLLT